MLGGKVRHYVEAPLLRPTRGHGACKDHTSACAGWFLYFQKLFHALCFLQIGSGRVTTSFTQSKKGQSRHGTALNQIQQSCDLVCSQLRLILSSPPEGSSSLISSQLSLSPCSPPDILLLRDGGWLRSSRPVALAPTPLTLSP